MLLAQDFKKQKSSPFKHIICVIVVYNQYSLLTLFRTKDTVNIEEEELTPFVEGREGEAGREKREEEEDKMGREGRRWGGSIGREEGIINGHKPASAGPLAQEQVHERKGGGGHYGPF